MLMSPPVVSLQSLENECEFIPRHIGPDAQEQQTMQQMALLNAQLRRAYGAPA